MARNRQTGPTIPNGDQQEEMVVFAIRLKGAGGTLQKGFDALTNAFGALGTPLSTPGRRSLAAGGDVLAPPPSDNDEVDSVGEHDDESQESATSPNSQPKRGARKYKFNDALDLSQGEKPWVVFAAQKAPDSDNKCYLVAAQWLAECAMIPEFSISDVFTLFRAMKWNEQSDFSQPLRKMKSSSSYFDNPTPKTWKLTSIGLTAARAVGNSASS